jgi:3-mercaptopyruvate sulfurtransferase SseA
LIEIWKWNKRKITHNQRNKNHENPIVSVDWLHEHLQDPELIILDANADRGYPNKGARTFDIKTKFSDT